jgi:hypothetical protein
MRATDVFAGSDGELTRRYYAALQTRGPVGLIAMNLFRAQKTSTRAKLYRGRRYKSAAYDVKSYSMSELCRVLADHGAQLGIAYGWKEDPATVFGSEPSWVLYVDLASYGQVSFHSPSRGSGPAYSGEWDGQHASERRFLAFCDHVFMGLPVADGGGVPEKDEQRAGSAPGPIDGQFSPAASARLRFGDPDSIALKRR